MNHELTLCSKCNCITKTIQNKCGKCGENKRMNRTDELKKEIETHKEIIENRRMNIHENASGN